jgi:hypothetical protein
MTVYENVRKIHRAGTTMDLNHILLFVAFLSPIVLIARSQRTAEVHRGWRTASVAVLIVTGAAWFFLPRTAGFIGGGAWVALLLLPAVASRKIADLTLRERFPSARRLAALLRFLHPADGVPQQTQLLHALEIAQRGETARALDLLTSMQSDPSRTSGDCTNFSASRRLGRFDRLVSRGTSSSRFAARIDPAALFSRARRNAPTR